MTDQLALKVDVPKLETCILCRGKGVLGTLTCPSCEGEGKHVPHDPETCDWPEGF